MWGLLKNTSEMEFILQEMMDVETSAQKMCEFFALLLVWHDVGDAREVFDSCQENFRRAFDPCGTQSDAYVMNEALRLIDLTLSQFGLSCNEYCLHFSDVPSDPKDKVAEKLRRLDREFEEERITPDKRSKAAQAYEEMPPVTEAQKKIFDAVIA